MDGGAGGNGKKTNRKGGEVGMKAPQIIMIVLISVDLILELILHGEEIPRKHNFVSELVAKALLCALLYWGGFWN